MKKVQSGHQIVSLLHMWSVYLICLNVFLVEVFLQTENSSDRCETAKWIKPSVSNYIRTPSSKCNFGWKIHNKVTSTNVWPHRRNEMPFQVYDVIEVYAVALTMTSLVNPPLVCHIPQTYEILHVCPHWQMLQAAYWPWVKGQQCWWPRLVAHSLGCGQRSHWLCQNPFWQRC